MASSATTIPNSHEPTVPLLIVNLSMVDKLTPLTYMSWSDQITDFLFGYDLLKFIDGTYLCPSPTVASPTEKDKDHTILNPAHMTWKRQDHLIKGALLATLPTNIQPLVLRATSSRDAWEILAKTYANPSRAHIRQIKDRLKHIKKNNLSITEYMNSIKVTTDQLTVLGKPMDPEDIVEKVFNGLDHDLYRSLIDNIKARDESISFEALHEKLLNFELSLSHNSTPAPFPTTANAATYRPRQQTTPSYHKNYTKPYNNTAPAIEPANNNDNRTSAPFKGRCQYCRAVGHVISSCFKFKRDYPTDHEELDNVAKLQKSQRYQDIMQKVEEALLKGLEVPEHGVVFEGDPKYQLVVDIKDLLVYIENEIIIIHNFICEKYRLKFPELESIVHPPIDYARVVKKIGNETDLTLVDLEGLLPSAIIMVVSVTASTTSGKPLPEDVLQKTMEACDRALDLDSARKKIFDVIDA
ncbi:hypothetical protein KSS87_006922 [Heliosperma pusillum]|nr:hypothetical protein KSS87_006922 [Heliosperma pusillum]